MQVFSQSNKEISNPLKFYFKKSFHLIEFFYFKYFKLNSMRNIKMINFLRIDNLSEQKERQFKLFIIWFHYIINILSNYKLSKFHK
jgi:hypothetical protein